MAIIRNIEATWKPSTTPDVVAQELRWFFNGRLVKNMVIRPDVSRAFFEQDNPRIVVKEQSKVDCMVRAVDDCGNRSAWVEANVEFPHSDPEPPTDLKLDYLPKHKDVT